MMIRSRYALVFAFACCLTPAAQAAPSKADVVAARKAVGEGKRQEGKKDWEAARAAYQQAVELNESAAVRIRLARAEDKLGHLIEAAENLRLALDNKKINWGQKRTAKKRLKDLEKRIPTLSLELPAGFEGEVFVDEEAIEAGARGEPVAVNPGARKVRATREGFEPFSETFELAEGETKSVTILLVEKKAPPPARVPEEAEEEKGSSGTQKTLGYVSLAIGGAGLVVGTAMGLAARSTKSELDKSCSSNVCSESDRELFDKGQTQANIATTGFVIGGVGLGLGAFLLLTADGGDAKKPAPADSAKLRLRPVLAPNHVGLTGTF